MPLLHLLGENLLVRDINLVDKNQNGASHALHLLQELGILVGCLHHIGYIEQDIGILKGTLGELQHLLLKLVVGLQHARSIRETNLHLGRIKDAHNTMACGLSLECSNTDTLAHQEVHERTFTHVGITYYVYKSCLMHIPKLRMKSEE